MSHNQALVFLDPNAMRNHETCPLTPQQFPKIQWDPNNHNRYKVLCDYYRIMQDYQRRNYFRTSLLLGYFLAGLRFPEVSSSMVCRSVVLGTERP